MAWEKLHALAGGPRKLGDVGEGRVIRECDCGFRCVGARAIGTRPEGLGIPYLRAGCPGATAVVAECKGNPCLVCMRQNVRSTFHHPRVLSRLVGCLPIPFLGQLGSRKEGSLHPAMYVNMLPYPAP